MELSKAISWFMGALQRTLFPKLEECWETALTDPEQQFVSILELIQVERFVPKSTVNQWLGRKLCERESIARSFVAKAVYGYLFTRTPIEAFKTSPKLRRIHGFECVSDIPCEATLSRVFREFAESGFGDRVHEALVERSLETALLGHISRDSTAIGGREKPVKEQPQARPAHRKKRLAAKGEHSESKEQKRLERQSDQSAEQALKELRVICDVGTKKNSK